MFGARGKLYVFFFNVCCFLQTEDKPLLPIAIDGGVDRREWTLQHHKAADITLTPPQADLDADCLDVNVKGPGEETFCFVLVSSTILKKIQGCSTT